MRSRPKRYLSLLVPTALLVAALGSGVVHGQSGEGSGQHRIGPFVELRTTSGSIPPLHATPTSEDPGPVAYSVDDTFRFNARWTNTRHAVTLAVADARDGGGATTMFVQGTAHPIADRVHLRQDAANVFGSVRSKGIYDPDASAYTAPPGFTLDSQGTVVVRTFAANDPGAGGLMRTIHWIYDGGRDLYWFDGTDKDFTNGGAVRVAPIGNPIGNRYTFPLDGLTYGVRSVSSAGEQYVPVVHLTWERQPGPAGGHDFDVAVLLDFPDGAPTGQYDLTIEATIHSLRGNP